MASFPLTFPATFDTTTVESVSATQVSASASINATSTQKAYSATTTQVSTSASMNTASVQGLFETVSATQVSTSASINATSTQAVVSESQVSSTASMNATAVHDLSSLSYWYGTDTDADPDEVVQYRGNTITNQFQAGSYLASDKVGTEFYVRNQGNTARYDSSGNQQWSRDFGGTDASYDDTNDVLYVSVYTHDETEQAKYKKVDPANGNVLNTYSLPDTDYQGPKVDKDGNVYFTFPDLGVVQKYNPDGNVIQETFVTNPHTFTINKSRNELAVNAERSWNDSHKIDGDDGSVIWSTTSYYNFGAIDSNGDVINAGDATQKLSATDGSLIWEVSDGSSTFGHPDERVTIDDSNSNDIIRTSSNGVIRFAPDGTKTTEQPAVGADSYLNSTDPLLSAISVAQVSATSTTNSTTTAFIPQVSATQIGASASPNTSSAKNLTIVAASTINATGTINTASNTLLTTDATSKVATASMQTPSKVNKITSTQATTSTSMGSPSLLEFATSTLVSTSASMSTTSTRKFSPTTQVDVSSSVNTASVSLSTAATQESTSSTTNNTAVSEPNIYNPFWYACEYGHRWSKYRGDTLQTVADTNFDGFDGDYTDGIHSIEASIDGDEIYTWSSEPQQGDVINYVAKWDGSGNKLWESVGSHVSYDTVNDRLYAIDERSDNDVIELDTTDGSTVNRLTSAIYDYILNPKMDVHDGDIFVTYDKNTIQRLAPDGTVVWSKSTITQQEPHLFYAENGTVTHDKRGSNTAPTVVKRDASNGSVLWEVETKGATLAFGIGSTDDTVAVSYDSPESYVEYIDSSGTLQWTNTYTDEIVGAGIDERDGSVLVSDRDNSHFIRLDESDGSQITTISPPSTSESFAVAEIEGYESEGLKTVVSAAQLNPSASMNPDANIQKKEFFDTSQATVSSSDFTADPQTIQLTDATQPSVSATANATSLKETTPLTQISASASADGGVASLSQPTLQAGSSTSMNVTAVSITDELLNATPISVTHTENPDSSVSAMSTPATPTTATATGSAGTILSYGAATTAFTAGSTVNTSTISSQTEPTLQAQATSSLTDSTLSAQFESVEKATANTTMDVSGVQSAQVSPDGLTAQAGMKDPLARFGFPIYIDGDRVLEITIDGEEVFDVTIDGDLVRK